MPDFNELHIVDIQSEETNPFADPDRADNGGGYSQPDISIKFSDGVSVSISDTSCGDFGSRVSASFTDGEDTFSAHWGSMEPDNYASNIDEHKYEEHLSIISEKLGYDIPSKQDCAAWDVVRNEDENDGVDAHDLSDDVGPDLSGAVLADHEFDEAFFEGRNDTDGVDDPDFDRNGDSDFSGVEIDTRDSDEADAESIDDSCDDVGRD